MTAIEIRAAIDQACDEIQRAADTLEGNDARLAMVNALGTLKAIHQKQDVPELWRAVRRCVRIVVLDEYADGRLETYPSVTQTAEDIQDILTGVVLRSHGRPVLAVCRRRSHL